MQPHYDRSSVSISNAVDSVLVELWFRVKARKGGLRMAC